MYRKIEKKDRSNSSLGDLDSRVLKQESRMAYGTADEALSLSSWLKIGSGEVSQDCGTSLSTSLDTKKSAALCKSN